MMEKNHAVINTSSCVGMNVSALNSRGYHNADLDNGVLVTLVKMHQDAQKNIEGFEWEVKPATETDLGLWIVKTPEVGTTLEQQLYRDPRYFYNAKGEPMSIMKLVPGCDYIEFEANAFSGKTLPDGNSNKFAKVTAGGKLVAAASAPAKGGHFEFVGKHYITIGAEDVPSVIMRYVEKLA